jgi:hypothetical protein
MSITTLFLLVRCRLFNTGYTYNHGVGQMLETILSHRGRVDGLQLFKGVEVCALLFLS